jgi:hypothetical protein
MQKSHRLGGRSLDRQSRGALPGPNPALQSLETPGAVAAGHRRAARSEHAGIRVVEEEGGSGVLIASA